jgi:hypothetical protein
MKKNSKDGNYSLKLFMRGGLGNQLFQFSGALFYAQQLSAKLILNETALARHHDSSRQNWISRLDLTNITEKTEVKWETDRRRSFSFQRDSFQNIEEDELVNLRKPESNLSFRGWFQYSSFPTNLNIDNRAFPPIYISESVLKQTIDITDSPEIAGIHMRFGDFKDTSWGMLSKHWYEKVFKKLEERGITHAHVFTDEIEVAKAMISGISNKFFVEFPEAERNLEPDALLWIMRHYKTFVSSNSTLSWWASYLNLNEDPVIFCPWGENLYLEPWIKID